jgi:hypothetical protein
LVTDLRIYGLVTDHCKKFMDDCLVRHWKLEAAPKSRTRRVLIIHLNIDMGYRPVDGASQLNVFEGKHSLVSHAGLWLLAQGPESPTTAGFATALWQWLA